MVFDGGKGLGVAGSTVQPAEAAVPSPLMRPHHLAVPRES